jgi:hypothetical protein
VFNLCLDVETDEACPCAGWPHTTQLRRIRQRKATARSLRSYVHEQLGRENDNGEEDYRVLQKPVDARIVKHNGVSEHWLNHMHVFVC